MRERRARESSKVVNVFYGWRELTINNSLFVLIFIRLLFSGIISFFLSSFTGSLYVGKITIYKLLQNYCCYY